MAKKRQQDVLNNLFDAVLQEDSAEKLTPDEAAALEAESSQATPEEIKLPSDVEEAKRATAEANVEATEVESPQVEAQAEEKPQKKLSPAQERITELVRERNAYEEQLRTEREKWARLDERAALVKEQNERLAQEEYSRQQAQEAAERRQRERPDASLDPVGAELFDTREKTRMLEMQLAQMQQNMQQSLAQTQTQQDVNLFTVALRNDLNQFRSRVADYDDAATFATQARTKMWTDLGYSNEQAMELVQRETLAVAKRALDIGKSPSETYYSLAQTWGWKPQQKGAETSRTAITPKEKLAQVAAGQKVTGFSRVPNTAESEGFDIESMSGADFAAMPEDKFIELSQNPQTSKRMMRRLQDLELA